MTETQTEGSLVEAEANFNPDYCGIYHITNTTNGEFYVGSSVDFRARFRKHKFELRKGIHKNEYLQRAWNKYGEENFSFELKWKNRRSDLKKVEQEHLDKEDWTYNIAVEAHRPNGPNWTDGDCDILKKAVIRIDPDTGERQEFESQSDAQRKTGVPARVISACCLGYINTAGQASWEFRDEPLPKQKTFKYDHHFRAVVGNSTADGHEIVLTTQRHCNQSGFEYNKIKKCCDGIPKFNAHEGYSWRYLNETSEEKLIREANVTRRPLLRTGAVRMTHLETGVVQVFASPEAAQEHIGLKMLARDLRRHCDRSGGYSGKNCRGYKVQWDDPSKVSERKFQERNVKTKRETGAVNADI